MKEIEAIKQALSAGPTPGPWYADNKFGVGPTSTDDDQSFGFVIPCAEVSGENIENDARLIAACNPVAMQAIIDHIDAQAAEIERLRGLINHTEAEVQQLMLCVTDWDVERSQYEALVRSILGVPQP